MRTAGITATLFCSIISLFLTWLGYICTFEEYQIVPDFETTPKEGWDYWMRLEFWHDVRAFSVWLALALGGCLVPLMAALRRGRPVLKRRTTDWALFGIAAIYGVLWAVGFLSGLRRAEPHPIQLLPLMMLAGALFGVHTFWLRATHAAGHTAQ